MRITDLQVTDLWGFGEDALRLESLGSHIVLIGRNNAGKSNVLQALRFPFATSPALSPGAKPLDPKKPDLHENEARDHFRPLLQVSFSLSQPEIDELLSVSKLQEAEQSKPLKEAVKSLLAGGITLRTPAHGPDAAQSQTFEFSTDPTFESLRGKSFSGLPGGWDKRFLEKIGSLGSVFLNKFGDRVVPIEARRRVVKGDSQNLAELRTPPMGKPELKSEFERVEKLFQRLTGLAGATLEPRPEQLLIRWEGKYLPIESMGDGVQNVLHLAIRFASAKDHVFLIEEPETNLHPQLQRALHAFIRETRENQFFLTTHSPTFLDAGRVEQIYRVEHNGLETSVALCRVPRDYYRLFDDLGTSVADLLQANVVIWVEGPTDAMFIRRCLELRGLSATEGIEYAFMHYGGKLRAHLCLDDEGTEPTERTNLLRLARHAVVVADSDRNSAEDTIGDSKQRLVAEVERVSGLSWITDGREIENYLPSEVVTAAYREILGKETIQISYGPFDQFHEAIAAGCKAVDGAKKKHSDYASNKTSILPDILRHLRESDVQEGELASRLAKLETFIRDKNDLGIPQPKAGAAES